MRLLVWISLLFFGTSSVAHSAVIFNEIAWMGTEESYLCNWIELYNSGDEAVDVADWSLYVDDTERPLSEGAGGGTRIKAGDYWLLERTTNTCSDALPKHDGWGILMGNLPNSGATLRLERADGAVEDQVAGGEEWSNLGGDNDTKATAQRTVDGWHTATPTPGAQNRSQSSSGDEVSTRVATSSETTSTSSAATPVVRGASASVAEPLTLPDTELALQLEIPKRGYVNQPLDLSVTPSGISETMQDSLVYTWNFGDTYTSHTQEPTHQFPYPGTYVVTVHAEYARHEQVARQDVTILPVPMSITVAEDGRVQIHNDAPYEVDVSNYTLVGRERVAFPPHSIILPRSSITIEAERLGLQSPGLLQLRDTEDVVVASNYEDLHTAIAAPTVAGSRTSATLSTADRAPRATAATTAAPASAGTNFAFAKDDAVAPPPQPATTTAPATRSTPIDNQATTGATTSTTSTTTDNQSMFTAMYEQWPMAGLLVLLGSVAGLLLYRPSHTDQVS